MNVSTDRTFGSPEEGVDYCQSTGAYLVLVRDGRLGVIRTPHGDTLPGGEVEGDESHEDRILRACLAQIGYDVRVDELIVSADAWTVCPTRGAYHPTQFYYSGELLDPLLEGVDSLEWISLDDIDTQLLPMQAFAVRRHVGRETSAAALAFIDGKHESYG